MSGLRPPLRVLLGLAVAFGVATGLFEVGLRSESRLGLAFTEQLQWLGISALISSGFLVVAALVAWAIGRRCFGLLFSALLFVHCALIYRIDFMVNRGMRELVVWGGWLLIGAACLTFGLLVDRFILKNLRSILVVLLGISVVGVSMTLVRSSGDTGLERNDQKNVLLVTLDTTRPDHLSAYGYEISTPAIQRLATEGVVFEEAVTTAPLTEPSHLAILTGNPPIRTGIVSNGTDLGAQPDMLTRRLQEEGWSTAAFVSAYPLHARYGWDQSFHVYDDDFGVFPGLHRLNLVQAWDQMLRMNTLRERRGDHTVGRALHWLEQHHEEPFFLWVHLYDPHAPYEAPDHPFEPPTEGERLDLPSHWPARHQAITSTEWLTEAYDAEIRYVDGQVERLLDRLDALDLTSSTIVMLTSDHGESLTEHDYLFDHGDKLYDPSLLVPWIVRGPGVIEGERVEGCQVSNMDVAPTLLTMLGIVDDADRLGVDRTPELYGEACRSVPVIATTIAGRWETEPPIDHALRSEGYKWILHEEETPECYGLESDPDEVLPLGEDCPEWLSTQLEAALEFGADPQSVSQDADTRQALEALGYVE